MEYKRSLAWLRRPWDELRTHLRHGNALGSADGTVSTLRCAPITATQRLDTPVTAATT